MSALSNLENHRAMVAASHSVRGWHGGDERCQAHEARPRDRRCVVPNVAARRWGHTLPGQSEGGES